MKSEAVLGSRRWRSAKLRDINAIRESNTVEPGGISVAQDAGHDTKSWQNPDPECASSDMGCHCAGSNDHGRVGRQPARDRHGISALLGHRVRPVFPKRRRWQHHDGKHYASYAKPDLLLRRESLQLDGYEQPLWRDRGLVRRDLAYPFADENGRFRWGRALGCDGVPWHQRTVVG